MAKILDSSDRVPNIETLKTLMHRKGLNMRFLWVLLAKVKLKQARDMIMCAILVRTMRKIVHEEVKIGSCIKPQVATSNPFAQAQASAAQTSSQGAASSFFNNFRRSSA